MLMIQNSIRILNYLCNIDNLEVPANDERYRSEDPDGDVKEGVDSRLGEAGPTAGLALPILPGQGADSEERRNGGGETEAPEQEDEQADPLTGQNGSVPEGVLCNCNIHITYI